MKEPIEKAEFMRKPIELANSSRQYIERLWKTGIDISKLSASISSLYSSIFDELATAVIRVISFSTGIQQLFLTRFVFLPPFDRFVRKGTPREEEYFPIEMGRANFSFLFNVNVARKIAAQLSRRVSVKTPKPPLFMVPMLPHEAEPVEETMEEPIEEPVRTVPYIVADLQSRFKAKLAPSIKDVTSVFHEYSKHAISLSPLLATHEPPLMLLTSLEGPPSSPLKTPPEKEMPPVVLREEVRTEPSPQVSIPILRLITEAARSLGFATRLPSVLLEQEIPILRVISGFLGVSAAKPSVSMHIEKLRPDVETPLKYATELPSMVLAQEIPILKRIAAYSLVSPPQPPLPSIEPSHGYPKPSEFSPMRPSHVSHVLEEISPSMTSWIYEASEALRGTSLSLSAVPIAASTAEKVVTEALTQPVSSFEEPKTYDTQETVSPSLTPSRAEASVGRAEVEAFRIPAIVASLVVALSQRYPLLFSEPTAGETYETSVELARFAPEEPTTRGRMPEMETYTKLPTVIALAAAESLIAQRLHHEFGALTREIQVARSSYGERLGELGTLRPVRTTMLSKLAASPMLSRTLQPYAPGMPAPSPPPRMSPISPTIQNTFNITVSAESAEEDLRDLERKINKILSEQMRRYYGSPRI